MQNPLTFKIEGGAITYYIPVPDRGEDCYRRVVVQFIPSGEEVELGQPAKGIITTFVGHLMPIIVP